jgi:hypothetical protein
MYQGGESKRIDTFKAQAGELNDRNGSTTADAPA